MTSSSPKIIQTLAEIHVISNFSRSDLAEGGIEFNCIIPMYLSTAVSGCDCNAFANLVYKLCKITYRSKVSE